MSFSLDLKRFSNLTESKMELLVKKTFIDLSTAVIKDTPVLSGRLRNSWFVDINSFAVGTSDSEDKSDKVINDVIRDTQPFKIGQTLTLVNNMSYAERIEYDGWSKSKSPKGMVRINIIRFQKWVDSNARSVK